MFACKASSSGLFFDSLEEGENALLSQARKNLWLRCEGCRERSSFPIAGLNVQIDPEGGEVLSRVQKPTVGPGRALPAARNSSGSKMGSGSFTAV